MLNMEKDKTISKFLEQWQLLFSDQKIDDVKIQKYSLSGYLEDSPLRSIAWRVLLKILPLNRKEWSKTISIKRKEYEELKAIQNFDPRSHIQVDSDNYNNNPLCLDEASPWCRYFSDRKLISLIKNDVKRTFPDIPCFQDDSIQETMVDLLFIYSKCHPHLSYRQGMHELLAPILFVLLFDQTVYQSLKQANYFSYTSQAAFSYHDIELLNTINNRKYFEHDSYAIFCQLMKLVECFYQDVNGNNDEAVRLRLNSTAAAIFRDHLTKIPFTERPIEPILSSLHKRIEFIHGELLMMVDPPLANHLKSLQILPQIYGIRWLRLLFGREFSFLNLLTIWDVIFADSSSQSMIDHIFVALLVLIRHHLLRSDYVNCTQYLMKYPQVKDVSNFIQFVLFLKYPQRYPIPDSMINFAQYVNPEKTIARSEWIWAKNNVTPPLKEKMENQRNQANRMHAFDNVLNKLGRRELAAAHRSNSNISRRHGEKISESSSSETNLQTMNITDRSYRNNSPASIPRFSPEHLDNNGNIELMKEQISLLQSRLNDVDFIGQISARKIRACADEMRMATPEARRRLMEELNEIAEQLTRSTVSVQYIMQNTQPPEAVSNRTKSDAVELASEVLGFRASSSTMAEAISRSRLSSKTLPPEGSNNEMIELRFDKKKNF